MVPFLPNLIFTGTPFHHSGCNIRKPIDFIAHFNASKWVNEEEIEKSTFLRLEPTADKQGRAVLFTKDAEVGENRVLRLPASPITDLS